MFGGMSERERPENVVAAAEAPGGELRDGEGQLRLRRRQLGRAAGGQQLGASLCTLLPGQASWPMHAHATNEEAIFVLSGRPTLRLATVSSREVREVELAPEDYAAFPAGPEHVRQLVNRTGEEVRYLVMSTMWPADVGFYPGEDGSADKVGVFAGGAPGGAGERWLTAFYAADAKVGYWERVEKSKPEE